MIDQNIKKKSLLRNHILIISKDNRFDLRYNDCPKEKRQIELVECQKCPFAYRIFERSCNCAPHKVICLYEDDTTTKIEES
jgi:hypothetical protein